MNHPNCPFCDVEKLKHVIAYGNVIVFPPLNPVTPGHMLVVPRLHVEDFTEAPSVTARTAEVAAHHAALMGHCNLITSKGSAATQTVKHLHFHLVPRHHSDGLHLPWTGQA